LAADASAALPPAPPLPAGHALMREQAIDAAKRKDRKDQMRNSGALI
jgi:hypothetical protein